MEERPVDRHHIAAQQFQLQGNRLNGGGSFRRG
jgi:hypothetical protein